MNNNIIIRILIAATIMLAACSNEDIPGAEPESSATTTQAEEYTEPTGFYGVISRPMEVLPEENLDKSDNLPTRSTMSDGAFAAWQTNDKISITDGTLAYTYQPSENTSDATCNFVAKAGRNSFETDGTGDDATFYAFYPADAVLGWNGSVLSTMIYTEQDYMENTEGSGVMGPYMAAVATTTGGGANATFSFAHICSVIDVDLSAFDGGTVDAVSLYANSQISIAGRLQFNLSTKAATVRNNDATDYSFSTQSEMVRVSDINALRPIVRFYVLPVRQTAGFTITVRTADGNYYTKSSSTSVGNTSSDGDYLASLSGVTGGNVCRPYYKKYNFGAISTARTQNWMSMIPGNVKFNFLSIPGTHDAATSSGTAGSTVAAKCQSYTIAEQLSMGCRALDLRPGFDKSNLEIYHGVTSTGVTLQNALEAVVAFLDNNPTETVFILIHEEDTRLLSIGSGPHQTSWATRVWNCVNGFTSHIAAYGWNGNLNPCRGKMVVIFRDNYTDGDGTADLGCGKVGWGSSFNDKSIMTGTGSNTANGTLRYQDEYNTSSTSDKMSNLTTMLNDHIAAMETNAGYTFVNNTNISSGTNNVSNYANSVNSAILASTSFTEHTGRFGIMMTDFLFSSAQKGDQIFDLIHKQNYKYVYKNRTRRAASASGTDTGLQISSDEYADGSQVYAKHRR